MSENCQNYIRNNTMNNKVFVWLVGGILFFLTSIFVFPLILDSFDRKVGNTANESVNFNNAADKNIHDNGSNSSTNQNELNPSDDSDQQASETIDNNTTSNNLPAQSDDSNSANSYETDKETRSEPNISGNRGDYDEMKGAYSREII